MKKSGQVEQWQEWNAVAELGNLHCQSQCKEKGLLQVTRLYRTFSCIGGKTHLLQHVLCSWRYNRTKIRSEVTFTLIYVLGHNAIKSCEILYVAFLSCKETAFGRYCQYMGGLLALSGCRPQTAYGTNPYKTELTEQ